MTLKVLAIQGLVKLVLYGLALATVVIFMILIPCAVISTVIYYRKEMDRLVVFTTLLISILIIVMGFLLYLMLMHAGVVW